MKHSSPGMFKKKSSNKKLENLFWAPEFMRPNRYTELPNSLDTSLTRSYFDSKNNIISIIMNKYNNYCLYSLKTKIYYV